MNSKIKQPAKISTNIKDCSGKSQKRLREKEEDDGAVVQINSNNNMCKRRRRQPKTLFRPWCDTKANDDAQNLSKHPKDLEGDKTRETLSTKPLPLTPYQMAVYQQRYQTAMAIQQAYYQRQLIMNHLWAQQQQQQQQILMYQQQQQQQLFVFGQQQRINYKN